MRLLASLRLSDIAWDDVRITFVDRVGAPGEVVTITVSHVQGQLRNISPMTPMPFDIAATVLTDSPRNIRVRGTVGPIPENLDIAGAPIDAQLQAADLLVAHLTPYLGQRFPLSWGRLGADVQVRGSGRGSIRIISALSLTDAALHGPREDEAAIAFPPLTRTRDLTLDLSSASVTLAEAQLHLFNLHASLTGAVSEIRTIPQFDLQLTTNAFAPGELLTQVPLLASAIPVSVDLHGRVQLQARLTGTPGKLRSEAQLEVNNLTLKSGPLHADSQSGGGFLIETDTTHVILTTHLEAPHPPHVHMDLRAQRLVFDQRESKAPVPGQTPPLGPTTKTPPAHAGLPPFTLNGTVRIADGRVHHLSFQHLTADVAWDQGRLKSRQQATLYGGSYQGTAQMNLAQGEPAYAVDARVAGVHLGAATRAWPFTKTVVEGVLTSQIKLSGRGRTWDRFRQTLYGNGHATITDLQVGPVDSVPRRMREVTILSPLGRITTHIRVKRQSFSVVKATLRLSQGRVFSDDLQLWGKEIEILAKGYLGLDQVMHYNGTVVLSGERAKAPGTLATLLRDAHGRLVLPFTVKRTLSDPQIEVDAKDLWHGRKTR
jgi:hypothetical protein